MFAYYGSVLDLLWRVLSESATAEPRCHFSPRFWGTYAPRFSKRQQTKVHLFWFGWWQLWSPSQQHMDTGHGWEHTNATLRGPRASPWHTESMGNLEQEGRHAHNTTWHEWTGHGDRGTHHTYRVIASLELPFWGKRQLGNEIIYRTKGGFRSGFHCGTSNRLGFIFPPQLVCAALCSERSAELFFCFFR